MSKQVSTYKIKNTDKQLVIFPVQTLCCLSSTENRQNGNPSEAINEVTVSEFNIMQMCTFTFQKVMLCNFSFSHLIPFSFGPLLKSTLIKIQVGKEKLKEIVSRDEYFFEGLY
jgi:hypothetical protein